MHYFLLQQMLKPFPKSEDGKTNLLNSNIFSFGGGYVNGGLSDEAWKILSEIWRYDYMGSAEFEFGALPESFQYIIKHKENYIFGEIEVEALRDKWDTPDKKDLIKKGTVYYFVEKEKEEELKKYIKHFANNKKKAPEKYFTKEFIGLERGLNPINSWDKDYGGWHCLHNHFFLFTDKEMFDKFQSLFSDNVSDN